MLLLLRTRVEKGRTRVEKGSSKESDPAPPTNILASFQNRHLDVLSPLSEVHRGAIMKRECKNLKKFHERKD